MVPIAMKEFEANGWATTAQLTDIVAIATMSPGPVGVNLAVGIGYKVAGIPGVVASFLGITLPTIILIILVSTFFVKIYKHPLSVSAFYGLRPVITGVIIYAAVSLAIKNSIIFADSDKIIANGYNLIVNNMQLFEAKSVLIMLAAFLLLLKTKITPVLIILASGLIGVMVF